MKRFAILLTAMAFAYGGYAQNCSKSRSSCNTSCSKSSKQVVVVTKDCSSSKTKTKTKDKKRRYERLLVMGGAGLHFLPNNSTYAINGRIGGTNQPQQYRNWDSEAMIGIRYGVRGTRRANVLGVFGNLGYMNGSTLNSLLVAQKVNQEVPLASTYEFRSVEVGFLYKEWFRLSGGAGYQTFTNSSGQLAALNYYTATTGLYIPLGKRLTWTAKATAYFGGEFSQQVTVRPSTGLVLRFKALRM